MVPDLDDECKAIQTLTSTFSSSTTLNTHHINFLHESEGFKSWIENTSGERVPTFQSPQGLAKGDFTLGCLIRACLLVVNSMGISQLRNSGMLISPEY
jgi:hypothetical protein